MVETIFKYFPNLNQRQREQFKALDPLYREWNKRVNLISRKDIDNLYLHHILHSLAIAKAIDIQDGDTILDIGTGGGFPGLPLAILYPYASFTLCDSIGKKIEAVKGVAKELQLENTVVKHQRVESIKERFTFGVTRAVASTSQLLEWSRYNIEKSTPIRSHGLVALKGVDIESEIEVASKKFNIPLHNFHQYRVEGWFSEEWFEKKGLLFIEL